MDKERYKRVVNNVLISRREASRETDLDYFIEGIEVEHEIQQDIIEDNKDIERTLKLHDKWILSSIAVSLICILRIAREYGFLETLYFTVLCYLYYIIFKLKGHNLEEQEQYQNFVLEVSCNQEEFLEAHKAFLEGKLQEDELAYKIANINSYLQQIPKFYEEESSSKRLIKKRK